jgi:hypothetical protein
MEEVINESLESVSLDRTKEDELHIPNKAIKRYNIVLNGKSIVVWMVVNQNNSGISFRENLIGNPIIVRGPQTTLERRNGNKTVSRDSLLGSLLIEADSNKIEYKDNSNRESTVLIFNQTEYTPTNSNGAAKNITHIINEEDNKEVFKFQTLKQAIKGILLTEEVETNEQPDETDFDNFLNSLLAVDSDENPAHNNFIIEDAQLRYQPTLNPIQNKIKRSNYFDNTTLIIEGGPGTGKTTSLLQRIKYLTDPEVIVDNWKKLSVKDESIINQLINKQNPKWIFFSPSELLYLYLKDSMAKEGLIPTDNNVKVWSNHKLLLMKQYGIFNSQGYSPFLRHRRKTNKNLIKNDGISCRLLIDSFTKHYLSEINNQITSLSKIDISNANWKNEFLGFINDVKNIKFRSIEDLVNFILNCYRNYNSKAKEIRKPYSDLINKATARRVFRFKKEDDIISQLTNLYKQQLSIDEPDETEEEMEDEELVFNSEFDKWLFSKTKSIINRLCLNEISKKASLSKSLKSFQAIVNIEVTDEEVKQIGELAIFNSKFYKWFTGFTRNIFAPIFSSYKRFRKSIVTNQDITFYNTGQLVSIIEADPKRLHTQEQAFLLGFINNVVKKAKNKTANESFFNHSYPSAYEIHNKYVIAVDESSDFHPIDLYAMHSLLNNKLNSFTLCGDLMQKLTFDGIETWSDIDFLESAKDLKSLNICYRQSPTLFNIASKIYEHTKGNTLDIQVEKKPIPNEPKALLYISNQEDQKLDWIGARIIEIYNRYGKVMPSIAIFTPNKENVSHITKELNENESLFRVGIEAVACVDGKILGDKNNVRVFDLNHIKGLEFEAVFFYDFDSVSRNISSNIALNNVYVGLSRATYFTAIISNTELEDELEFLNNLFVKNENWQM